MSAGIEVEVRCINLKRRPDRRFVIQKTLPKELRSQLQFFNAVDSRNIARSRAKMLNIGSSGYAVNLSKRLAIRAFLKGKAEALLVLEDDVSFEPDFGQHFEALMKIVPDDWGMIFLGGEHKRPPEEIGVPDMVRCVRVHYNHAWLLHRRAAKMVLQALSRKPFIHAFSDQTIGLLQTVIPTYAPRNWMVFQRRGLSDNMGGMRWRADWEIAPYTTTHYHEDELAVVRAAMQRARRILQWGIDGSTLLMADWLSENCRFDCVDFEKNVALSMQEVLRRHRHHLQIHLHFVDQNLRLKQIRPIRSRREGDWLLARPGKQGCNLFDVCVIDATARAGISQPSCIPLVAGGVLILKGALDPRGKDDPTINWLRSGFVLKFAITHTPEPMSLWERL